LLQAIGDHFIESRHGADARRCVPSRAAHGWSPALSFHQRKSRDPLARIAAFPT
jgi:hypothetical protein